MGISKKGGDKSAEVRALGTSYTQEATAREIRGRRSPERIGLWQPRWALLRDGQWCQLLQSVPRNKA